MEELLSQMRAARADPGTQAARAVLTKGLTSSSGAVVASAAQVIGEAELKDFTPALAVAFTRLTLDAAKSDPGCKGKTAILHALLNLEADENDVFLTGVRYRQLEPAWGGSFDSAAELRGNSALGLLRARHPQAPLLVAELLADPEPAARSGAARALAELDSAAALPLLRFKVAIGDENPEVVGACFSALIDHAPDVAFELARSYLAAQPGAGAEAVALALGESRRPATLPLLRDYAADADDSGRAVAFVAITLLRDDKANEHLLEVVARGAKKHAADAVRALAHFRHDPKIKVPALKAAESRGDSQLLDLAARAFSKE